MIPKVKLANCGFDDQYSSASFYDFDNKKIEIHFNAYYDLLLNEYVEKPCILVIEKWTEAKSGITKSVVEVSTAVLKDEYVPHAGNIVIERWTDSKTQIVRSVDRTKLIKSAMVVPVKLLKEEYADALCTIMFEKVSDITTRITKTTKHESIDMGTRAMAIITTINLAEYKDTNLHLEVSTLYYPSMHLFFIDALVYVVKK